MKTIVIKEHVGNKDLRSRVSINCLKEALTGDNDYILDMNGIEFISRSAADELYNIVYDHKGIKIVNQAETVKQMTDIV